MYVPPTLCLSKENYNTGEVSLFRQEEIYWEG